MTAHSIALSVNQKEETLRHRHDDIMKTLMKERERELLSIGQDAKRNVHEDAMVDLESEYDLKQQKLRALEASFHLKQEEIRNTLLSDSDNVHVN